MHYFKKNLGDYAKKTGRLSMLQHGAYTLLIDTCYDREEFPTHEEAIEWTWASTKEEIEAVEFVLKRFFTFEDGRYVQNRIQEEIAEYHSKAETNKRIAIERETKRKEKNTNRAPLVHEPPPNQEPLTINHKPLTINQEPKEKTKPLSPNSSATRFDPKKIELPECIKPKDWAQWIDYRREKRISTKERTMLLQIRELEGWFHDGHDPGRILHTSMVNDWSGIFEPKSRGSPAFGQTRDNKADSDVIARVYEQEALRANQGNDDDER